MLFFCFTLFSLAHSLLAVELSIYKSFTEVRQAHSGVGEYMYPFANNEYGNIIDGSISWDGTPFTRQEVFNTIQSLQDAKVIVRRTSVCGCDTIEAKIVDPNSMLLQNLKTGAYFYADKQSVEYTSTRPNESGTTLRFEFKDKTTQHTGTLSYLMRGITWKPDYDLLLTGNNDCKVRAYANIKNDQQREYTVENTHLFGGDVQLANNVLHSGDRFETEKFSLSMLRPIEMAGEQKGLYSYSLNDKYTIRPLSSIRLPFIDILAKYRFYYKASTNINIGEYQGVFEKTYDLTPNQFMPAGVITIRDNQVLVGQANLPDVPKNYTQTISVGHDYDVRFLVKGNLTSKSDDKAPIQLESYAVDVQMMNFKDKSVNAELVLSGGIQMTLVDATCKSAKVTGNQVNLGVQLEKGESRLCKFNITVRLA
jgi:hypothetical protein